VGRARCDLAAKDSADAIASLDKALAAAPVVEAARLLSDAKRMAGDDAGADAAHQRALSLAQKNDKRSYAVLLATDAIASGDDAMLGTAQQLLDDESSRADILTEDARALVAFARGDTTSAQEHITRATRLGTPDAALWLHKGVIEHDRKLVAKAIAMQPHLDAMHTALAQEAGLL
jgi:Flp pilus assembly protein TadD